MIDSFGLLASGQRTPLRQIVSRFGLYGAVLSLVFLGACSKRPTQARPGRTEIAPAAPVTVAAVQQRTTPIERRTFGTVEAYASVEVKTQITGILTGVHFIEGQMVKKADLLLSIDPRQQQAALKAAQANLQRDEALLRNAEKEAARQTELLRKGFASQDEYDGSVTAVETLQAAINAGKAAIEDATLQLEYCSVRSPIDGCTGILHVNMGNLVKANDTSVVTIKQMDPIYVSFWIEEQFLPAIQKYMGTGSLDTRVIQPYENREPIHGSLTFVDNTVDASTSTRTIRLRATFSNKDLRLWPGQYVDVVLTFAQEPNSLVIPSQAIQSGQKNQFVYVVKSDQTVEARPITVKRAVNSGTANETVVEGVQAGEVVVTDGQLRVVPGAPVQIKNPTQN